MSDENKIIYSEEIENESDESDCETSETESINEVTKRRVRITSSRPRGMGEDDVSWLQQKLAKHSDWLRLHNDLVNTEHNPNIRDDDIKSVQKQLSTIILLCAIFGGFTFIFVTKLEKDYPNKGLDEWIGIIAILTTSLFVLTALFTSGFSVMLEGVNVSTRKESIEVTKRAKNGLSFLFIVGMFSTATCLFMSLICLLSFNALRKQYQAIVLTIIIAGGVVLWFIWVIVLSVLNTPPKKLESSTTVTMLLRKMIPDVEKGTKT